MKFILFGLFFIRSNISWASSCPNLEGLFANPKQKGNKYVQHVKIIQEGCEKITWGTKMYNAETGIFSDFHKPEYWPEWFFVNGVEVKGWKFEYTKDSLIRYQKPEVEVEGCPAYSLAWKLDQNSDLEMIWKGTCPDGSFKSHTSIYKRY